MEARIPISKRGHEKLKEELKYLQQTERIAVIRAIETAREHGDLRENAEFHAAKERQSFVEGRISELKYKLGRAEVVDCSKVDCRRVVFGTKVTMVDLNSDETLSYLLLGPEEADVKKGSISILSPLGRAMIGREIGDEIKVKTPGGVRELEIIEIGRAEDS